MLRPLLLAAGLLAATAAHAQSPYCQSVPFFIPDEGQASSDLVVTDSQVLDDLNVTVHASHSWVGDLIFTLTKGATSVTFIDRPGHPAVPFGCEFDNINAALDDEGASGAVETMCNPTPPAISGTPTPNSPLAAFDGQTVDGTWTLTVSDNAPQDNGLVNVWCLVTTPVPVELMGFEVE
jgi:proprotein convertase P-domain-containing protein